MKKKKKIIAGFIFRMFLILCVWQILEIITPAQVCRASDLQDEDLSALEEGLIDQLEMDEINESLEEMFPEEKLDFKEVLMGVLSGNLTFSAELLNQLVTDQIGYAFRVSPYSSDRCDCSRTT